MCLGGILEPPDEQIQGLEAVGSSLKVTGKSMFLVSTPVRGHARVDIWVWGRVGVGGVGRGWGGVGWDVNVHVDGNHIVRSPALPHIRHATLLHVLLHFHTYVMLRARTACYADGCKFAKLGKEPPNNKCQKNASNGQTLPTTAVSCEAWPKHRLLTDSGMGRQWDVLKTHDSPAVAYT